MAVVTDRKIGYDTNGDTVVNYYKGDIASIQDYYPFGMVEPGRSYTVSGGYRFGFNDQEKDDEFKGSGNSYDFGARIYDPRIGRWAAIDPKSYKYIGYSPYHFGYCNPIIVIDPDGEENIIVVGNQAAGNGDAPSSDFKNNERKKGYKYGENRRHFLEAGLNEAIRLKNEKTENNEVTTMIVYKGNYTEAELNYYRKKAELNHINFIVVNNASEIINYINQKSTKDLNPIDKLRSMVDGTSRLNDAVTDFSYIGHGSPYDFKVGYNDNVNSSSIFESKDLSPIAFSHECNIFLGGCGQGNETSDLPNYQMGEPTMFEDFRDRIIGPGGSVTGYRTTTLWGTNGLGTFTPTAKGYVFVEDRNGTMGRDYIPPEKRKNVSPGTRK